MSIISRLFKRNKKKCPHALNWKQRRWIADDGKLMVHFECFDCGFMEEEELMGDSEGWEGFTLVIDGKEIKV